MGGGGEVSGGGCGDERVGAGTATAERVPSVDNAYTKGIVLLVFCLENCSLECNLSFFCHQLFMLDYSAGCYFQSGK